GLPRPVSSTGAAPALPPIAGRLPVSLLEQPDTSKQAAAIHEGDREARSDIRPCLVQKSDQTGLVARAVVRRSSAPRGICPIRAARPRIDSIQPASRNGARCYERRPRYDNQPSVSSSGGKLSDDLSTIMAPVRQLPPESLPSFVLEVVE